MIVESTVLLCVAIMLFVACARAKHLGYAFAAALPVVVVPILYFAAVGLLYLTGSRFFGIRPELFMAFMIFLAVVLACVVVFMFSRQIQSKVNRNLYFFVMVIYNVTLGWIYLYNMVKPILQPLLF